MHESIILHPCKQIYFPTTRGFRMKISRKLVCQYMAIFFNFSLTMNHFHSLQVENCDSNSRLVVDEMTMENSGMKGLTTVHYTVITYSNNFFAQILCSMPYVIRVMDMREFLSGSIHLKYKCLCDMNTLITKHHFGHMHLELKMRLGVDWMNIGECGAFTSFNYGRIIIIMNDNN